MTVQFVRLLPSARYRASSSFQDLPTAVSMPPHPCAFTKTHCQMVVGATSLGPVSSAAIPRAASSNMRSACSDSNRHSPPLRPVDSRSLPETASLLHCPNLHSDEVNSLQDTVFRPSGLPSPSSASQHSFPPLFVFLRGPVSSKSWHPRKLNKAQVRQAAASRNCCCASLPPASRPAPFLVSEAEGTTRTPSTVSAGANSGGAEWRRVWSGFLQKPAEKVAKWRRLRRRVARSTGDGPVKRIQLQAQQACLQVATEEGVPTERSGEMRLSGESAQRLHKQDQLSSTSTFEALLRKHRPQHRGKTLAVDGSAETRSQDDDRKRQERTLVDMGGGSGGESAAARCLTKQKKVSLLRPLHMIGNLLAQQHQAAQYKTLILEKSIPKLFSCDGDDVDQTLRNVYDALLSLPHHYHVMRLVSVTEHAKRFSTQLERMHGGELFDFLVSRRQPCTVACPSPRTGKPTDNSLRPRATEPPNHVEKSDAAVLLGKIEGRAGKAEEENSSLKRDSQQQPAYPRRRDPISDDVCRSLIFQLLKGLHHLHSFGLLHRDVKPENIMFRSKPSKTSALLQMLGLLPPSPRSSACKCGTFSTKRNGAAPLVSSATSAISSTTSDAPSATDVCRLFSSPPSSCQWQPQLQLFHPAPTVSALANSLRSRQQLQLSPLSPTVSSRPLSCITACTGGLSSLPPRTASFFCPSSSCCAPVLPRSHSCTRVPHTVCSFATTKDAIQDSSSSDGLSHMKSIQVGTDSFPATDSASSFSNSDLSVIPAGTGTCCALCYTDLPEEFDIALIDIDSCKVMANSANPQNTRESKQKISVGTLSHPTRRLVGTPAYMPPEVLAGEEATVTADLWAVGILLYIMVTGAPPVEMHLMTTPKKALAVLKKHETTGFDYSLTPFPRVPLAIDLCSRLLAFDPKQRIASASEALLHPWIDKGGQARRYLREYLNKYTPLTRLEEDFRATSVLSPTHSHSSLIGSCSNTASSTTCVALSPPSRTADPCSLQHSTENISPWASCNNILVDDASVDFRGSPVPHSRTATHVTDPAPPLQFISRQVSSPVSDVNGQFIHQDNSCLSSLEIPSYPLYPHSPLVTAARIPLLTASLLLHKRSFQCDALEHNV